MKRHFYCVVINVRVQFRGEAFNVASPKLG